jgi:hypothetical protein
VTTKIDSEAAADALAALESNGLAVYQRRFQGVVVQFDIPGIFLLHNGGMMYRYV